MTGPHFNDDWIAISNKQALAAAYMNWNHIVFQEGVNLLTMWSMKYNVKLEYEFSFADYMKLVADMEPDEQMTEEEAFARLKFLSVQDVITFFKERESHA